MYIALDLFLLVPFTVLFSTVVSVTTGVGGCVWPISDRAVCTDVEFLQFPNNPPNYASLADVMTFLIILFSHVLAHFLG